MNAAKILLHPLLAATVGLALAASWAAAYHSASEQARQAGASIRPLTELAREQLADVGACEGAAFAGPGSAPDPRSQAAARRRAFDCAAPYLLAQPAISAAAASQALGYAAGAAHREASFGAPPPPPALFAQLAAAAERDARSATRLAEAADARVAHACSGFLAAPACSLAGLSPDRPDRRLADAMREFEVDLRAQRRIVEAPQEESSYRALSQERDPESRFSPAYVQARREVAALAAPAR